RRSPRCPGAASAANERRRSDTAVPATAAASATQALIDLWSVLRLALAYLSELTCQSPHDATESNGKPGPHAAHAARGGDAGIRPRRIRRSLGGKHRRGSRVQRRSLL